MAINEVSYFGFRRTRGDASRVDSNSRGVPALLVPTTDRDLHVASAADELTDWNVANPTHPTLYLHSETTPATDYLALYHDATNGYLNVASGNLVLQIDATTIVTVASTGVTISSGNLTIPDDALLGLGTGNTARFSWDTTDANANALLLQMPAGGAVDVPVLAIGQSIESVDLGLYNGVTEPRIAMFGVGAVTTGPVIEFRKARGTIAAPTVVTTGDDLGTIDFYGAVAAGEYVRAASIRADMTGTIATTRGPGNLSFNVATDAAPSVMTERLLITGSGAITLTPATDVIIANGTGVIVGHTAQITAAFTAELQVLGTGVADGALTLGTWSAASAGTSPLISFVRSRGANIGDLLIVQSGDQLGAINFYGDDSGDYATPAASIAAAVDNTPGANDLPGRLVFYTTADGANTLTERLRIDSSGVLILGSGEQAAPAATGNTLRAPDVTTTGGAGNVAGADLTVAAGLGTGTGDVGQIIFQLPIEAGAGNIIQTRATRLTLDMASSSTVLTMLAAQAMDISVPAATASTFRVTDGTTAFYALDSRVATAGVTTHTFGISAYTIASAAGNVATALSLPGAHTLNYTGNTQVTSVVNTITVGVRTIAADGVPGALTVDQANSLSIAAPTEGANVTLTAASAFRVLNAGGTPTNQYGLYIEDLTAGGSDYGIYIAGADTAAIYVASADPIHLGVAGASTGKMEFDGATSGTVTFTVGATAGTWTMTLPGSAGEANQLLQTNGSGTTTWVDGVWARDTQLTDAQVRALRAAPISLVPAPGANKAIIVHKVYLVCDAAAGAYTANAGDDMVVEYAGGTDITGAIEATGFITGAAVAARTYGVLDTELTPAANAAVQLFNTGGVEFGAGNAANTLSVRVWYSIVDTVAFS